VAVDDAALAEQASRHRRGGRPAARHQVPRPPPSSAC